MLQYRGNGKYPYPISSIPYSNPTVILPFSAYEIPQFTLISHLRPKGARMPREEANILGKIKYNLQLNHVGLNCRRD